MLLQFFKDSAIYAVPAIVSRGLSLFLIPVYTRVLGPADYGALDLLLVFVSLVNLTVALEVSQGLARFYSGETDQSKRADYASSAFWFTVASYTLFAAVAAFYSRELANVFLGRDEMNGAFRIGIVYAWINGIFYLIQNQFRWEGRSRHYAVVSLLSAFLTAIVAVCLTYGMRWGLEGVLLGMVLGALAGSIYGLWNLRHSFHIRFDGTRLKEMLLFSAPLVPSGIAVFVSTYIDRLMINHFMSLYEVGLYGIGFRLASISGLVLVGFQGALTPMVYRSYQERETSAHLANIFRVFVSMALLVYAVLTLFAHEILVLITIPDYYSSAQVVSLLVPGILLSQMYIFCPGIAIARKMYLVLLINLGGALLNTLFNWFLIPVLGLSGAALATLLGYASVFAAYMFFSQRFYYIPYDWPRICLAVILIIPLGFIPLSGLEAHQQWVAKLVSLIFVGSVILLTGLVRPAEIRQLKQMVLARSA